jgi:hypothetical protein
MVGRIDDLVSVIVADIVGVERLRRTQSVVDAATVVRRSVEVPVFAIHA